MNNLTSKANLLCVLKVMQDYTDENHTLKQPEVISKLENEYGRKIDRRTLYSAVDTLNEFGFEIHRPMLDEEDNDSKKGFYLANRQFSFAEIQLLIDAVYSCEYISPEQTKTLLGKLKECLNVHDRKKFVYTGIITPDKKSPNNEVFSNIENLESAISLGKQISFTYMDYNYSKKLEPRRKDKYTANPYSMLCSEGKYYLILIFKGHTDPSYCRIDMMKDISILDEKISISRRNANLDSIKKNVYAFSGEPQRITMKCSKKVLRYVIEKFGKDVFISPIDDTHFEASVSTSKEGLIYWALQYLQDVEVTAPESIREEIIKAIKNNPYKA